MTFPILRSAILVAAIFAVAACGTSSTEPTEPGSSPQAPPLPAPVPPPPVPSLPTTPPAPELAPSSIYDRGVDGTRYVLYADSTFRLEFPRGGFWGFWYSGVYSRSKGVITFKFDGNWNNEGFSWGEERGDSLLVRYTGSMNMSDFENSPYLSSPAAVKHAAAAIVYDKGPSDTRFVLFPDNTFRLLYVGSRHHWYSGTYTQSGAAYSFTFDQYWNPTLKATGEVAGSSMTVRYLSYQEGFLEGQYLLAR